MLRGALLLLLVLLAACGRPSGASAQDTLKFFDPAPAPDTARIRGTAAALGAAYAVSMAGLYQLWYRDYPLRRFHFFDDGAEWLQFDKVGHLGSAYYIGKWGIGLFRWTGLDERRAAWYGGMQGFVFLTMVEVFDGFSEAWGFSWSDMAFNTAGTALVMSQQLGWHEQRLALRFSYHGSEFADYRPDQFGSGYPERWFKDYNGSSVWLSANLRSFTGGRARWIPPWLNVAAGYGVEGLTGARENVAEYGGLPVPAFERYRQYYLSLDVDLSRIPTRSGFLKTVFGVFGFLKVPAPALEFNRVDRLKFHWFYY